MADEEIKKLEGTYKEHQRLLGVTDEKQLEKRWKAFSEGNDLPTNSAAISDFLAQYTNKVALLTPLRSAVEHYMQMDSSFPDADKERLVNEQMQKYDRSGQVYNAKEVVTYDQYSSSSSTTTIARDETAKWSEKAKMAEAVEKLAQIVNMPEKTKNEHLANVRRLDEGRTAREIQSIAEEWNKMADASQAYKDKLNERMGDPRAWDELRKRLDIDLEQRGGVFADVAKIMRGQMSEDDISGSWTHETANNRLDREFEGKLKTASKDIKQANKDDRVEDRTKKSEDRAESAEKEVALRDLKDAMKEYAAVVNKDGKIRLTTEAIQKKIDSSREKYTKEGINKLVKTWESDKEKLADFRKEFLAQADAMPENKRAGLSSEKLLAHFLDNNANGQAIAQGELQIPSSPKVSAHIQATVASIENANKTHVEINTAIDKYREAVNKNSNIEFMTDADVERHKRTAAALAPEKLDSHLKTWQEGSTKVETFRTAIRGDKDIKDANLSEQRVWTYLMKETTEGKAIANGDIPTANIDKVQQQYLQTDKEKTIGKVAISTRKRETTEKAVGEVVQDVKTFANNAAGRVTGAAKNAGSFLAGARNATATFLGGFISGQEQAERSSSAGASTTTVGSPPAEPAKDVFKEAAKPFRRTSPAAYDESAYRGMTNDFAPNPRHAPPKPVDPQRAAEDKLEKEERKLADKYDLRQQELMKRAEGWPDLAADIKSTNSNLKDALKLDGSSISNRVKTYEAKHKELDVTEKALKEKETLRAEAVKDAAKFGKDALDFSKAVGKEAFGIAQDKAKAALAGAKEFLKSKEVASGLNVLATAVVAPKETVPAFDVIQQHGKTVTYNFSTHNENLRNDPRITPDGVTRLDYAYFSTNGNQFIYSMDTAADKVNIATREGQKIGFYLANASSTSGKDEITVTGNGQIVLGIDKSIKNLSSKREGDTTTIKYTNDKGENLKLVIHSAQKVQVMAMTKDANGETIGNSMDLDKAQLQHGVANSIALAKQNGVSGATEANKATMPPQTTAVPTDPNLAHR